MRSNLLVVLLLAMATLAGCSGSSSSSSNPTSSTVSKVSITSGNQSTITNAAINSATQNLAGSNLAYVGGVQTSTTPTNERVFSKWTDFAFKKLVEHQSTPLSVSGAVTSSACTTSGNITFDTDGSSTTAYTYFTLSFNNCVESGTTANGTISLSNLNRIPSTGTPTSISAKFTFNLTVSNASTSSGIYGGFDIAATGINSTTRIDSISGTSFNFKYGSQFETLTNFAFTSSYDDTTTSHGYSDTVHYTFASDVILAGFDFTTVTALVRNFGDVYPRSGQVIITGANLTKLKATIDDTDVNKGTASGHVLLQLSQDNGANYGTAVPKTWTELEQGL